MSQVLAHHIIRDLCDELNIRFHVMAGSTKNHTSFRLFKSKKPHCRSLAERIVSANSWTPWLHNLDMYGTCTGSKIALGTTRNRQELDLHHPDSIPRLVRYLKSDRHWKEC